HGARILDCDGSTLDRLRRAPHPHLVGVAEPAVYYPRSRHRVQVPRARRLGVSSVMTAIVARPGWCRRGSGTTRSAIGWSAAYFFTLCGVGASFAVLGGGPANRRGWPRRSARSRSRRCLG